MDYTAMKKDELLALVLTLQNKLEEQKHLAEAVNAKDEEIAKLSKHSADSKASYVKEIEGLKVKISELTEQVRNAPSVEKFKDVIKGLEEKNKELVAFANRLINIQKNTFKALQGNLDNAIELHDILINGVKEN